MTKVLQKLTSFGQRLRVYAATAPDGTAVGFALPKEEALALADMLMATERLHRGHPKEFTSVLMRVLREMDDGQRDSAGPAQPAPEGNGKGEDEQGDAELGARSILGWVRRHRQR